jgi:hypothetical protein
MERGARVEHSARRCISLLGEIYYYLNGKADGTLVGYVPRNYSTFPRLSRRDEPLGELRASLIYTFARGSNIVSKDLQGHHR